MRSISISQLKATMSRQLARVAAGTELTVTDRGRAVAKVIPTDPSAPADAQLRLLERKGLVRVGRQRLGASFFRARRPSDPRASLRHAVIEERETGW